MKVSKFFKGMIMVTALSLIYIHMQMQIFNLAYQAKRKEQFMKRLQEDNGNLTYHILKLKSSYHLGDQLLSERSDMHFVDYTQIVRLEAQAEEQDKVVLSAGKRGNPLLSFLSLGSQAEARSQE